MKTLLVLQLAGAAALVVALPQLAQPPPQTAALPKPPPPPPPAAAAAANGATSPQSASAPSSAAPKAPLTLADALPKLSSGDLAGLVGLLPKLAGDGAKGSGGFSASTGGVSLQSILGALQGLDYAGSTQNDVENGPCRDAFLVVARGSAEPGNVGVTVGPLICKGLREKFGDKFGCQGIDPKAYTAGLLDNVQPKGTSESSIAGGVKQFTAVADKCPNAVLAAVGYSQGAAVLHSVIPALAPRVRAQIAAVLLYGDTKNKQLEGKIEGVPTEKIKGFCVADDGVCAGGLEVTAGHLAYLKNGDTQKGVEFAAAKLEEALKARRPS